MTENADGLFLARASKMGALAVLAALGLCLVTGRPAAAAEVVDLVGRRVAVPDHPRRVVSLAPSLTEMVFALGAGDRLAGVSRYSDYPPRAAELPKVGSYVHPDLERIVALKPDLCLAVKDGNPREAVERLEALGIPVYAVNPKNLKDVMDTMTALGRVLGREQQAREIVGSMGRRIRAVEEKMAGVSGRPRVFFQIGTSPIVSVGTETFAHEIITLAGGINVAEGPDPYPRFSVEQVLGLRPEVIVISSMDRSRIHREIQAGWMRWQGLPAVENGRVFLVESNLFDRPTPRLVDGLEVLARLLHPEVFHGNP
ncbi:ABC transporter substrate-binding protein [Desulfacinum infernum]|nr:cobalamin-binding protein [Desulfacinum infernum]